MSMCVCMHEHVHGHVCVHEHVCVHDMSMCAILLGKPLILRPNSLLCVALSLIQLKLSIIK